jgi:hypothetical protein
MGIAAKLKAAGYHGLFQYEDRTECDSIWENGRNKDSLIKIVSSSEFEDYTRLLASEILFERDSSYPPSELFNKLAVLYSQALRMSGGDNNIFIPANQWGFMYFSDKPGYIDYGILGNHLLLFGKVTIPYLILLLNDEARLLYEGSQEALIGNSQRYRVKDAAAYYIGKIAGISVQFHEDYADRDAEIERLKEKLK